MPVGVKASLSNAADVPSFVRIATWSLSTGRSGGDPRGVPLEMSLVQAWTVLWACGPGIREIWHAGKPFGHGLGARFLARLEQ